MLKLFGTNRCRRCGSSLEHTTDEPDGPPENVGRPDAKLVCLSCGLSRPLIYAHVRSLARDA
jgi:hypothetical protein